jgi:ribosomal protein L37AE/L43A
MTRTDSQREYKRNYEQAATDKYPCPYCPRKSRNERAQNMHIKLAHKDIKVATE